MNLNKVKIVDYNFAHASYSTDFIESKYIRWDRDLSKINPGEPIFFTDASLSLANPVTRNIGWLMEPPAINSHPYSIALENIDKFECILTYSKNLLDQNSKFIFYPHSGCWIKEEDWSIYEKNKMVSIVASNKGETVGHQLRHQIISSINSELRVFGRGYNPIPYKLPAFQEFRFSYVIENSKIDYYFTEKLMDCLLTGTVPIYYGCPSIGNFFNTDGFIIIDNLEDAVQASESLSTDLYNSKMEAIKENFEKAKKYVIAEDWIYENTKIFTEK